MARRSSHAVHQGRVTVPDDDDDELLAHRRSTAVTVTAWLVVAGLTLAVALPVLALVLR